MSTGIDIHPQMPRDDYLATLGGLSWNQLDGRFLHETETILGSQWPPTGTFRISIRGSCRLSALLSTCGAF